MPDPGRSVDVLVVGAGPAGLATAIEARLRGLSARVIDRRRPPLDKPCGEGLMPDGLERLRAMGVPLSADAFHPIRGIRYLDGDAVADGRFPNVNGAGVRRLHLHRALVARAEELGVELLWRHEARSVDPETGEVEVRDLEQERSETLSGRFVAVADGLRSPLRRDLGLEGAPDRRPRFGVRRHYALAPWTDLVEVYWGDHAEAYVTPVGDREVGVAMLWGERKAGFYELLAGFPALEHRLREAEPTSKVQGIGPLRQRVEAVTRGRVALVGDAAGYVDAITGEGLSLAFHQASALAEALARGDLSAYPKRCRAVARLPDLLTELLLWIERRPRLRRRVVRALARDPRIFDRFLAVHSRTASSASLLPFVPRMVWRLAGA